MVSVRVCGPFTAILTDTAAGSLLFFSTYTFKHHTELLEYYSNLCLGSGFPGFCALLCSCSSYSPWLRDVTTGPSFDIFFNNRSAILSMKARLLHPALLLPYDFVEFVENCLGNMLRIGFMYPLSNIEGIFRRYASGSMQFNNQLQSPQ